MKKRINLVCKIGSTALLNKDQKEIDIDVFNNLSRNLNANDILITSGALELGKIEYAKMTGKKIEELKLLSDIQKAKMCSIGQVILMETYKKFFANYGLGVEQLIIEHEHYNNEQKREQIRKFLSEEGFEKFISIINYNDAVDSKEIRKYEIEKYHSEKGFAVDLTDNDETAIEVSKQLKTKKLLILSQLDGIYKDINDRNSLIEEIRGATAEETITKLKELKKFCYGASREDSNGAKSKIDYIADAIRNGVSEVYLASSHSDISKIISGKAKQTRIINEGDKTI